MRAAIEERYVVGGSTRVAVPVSEVVGHVATALEEPVVRPWMYPVVGAIMVGKGATPVRVANRRWYASARNRDVPFAEAARLTAKTRMANRAGKVGTLGKPRDTPAASQDWEGVLTAEGMPAEVDPIDGPRVSTYRRAGPTVAQAEAFLSRAMATGGVQAAIYSGVHGRAGDLLAELDIERKVLAYRTQGLSVRRIAVLVDCDKMRVFRMLRRIEKRIKRQEVAQRGLATSNGSDDPE